MVSLLSDYMQKKVVQETATEKSINEKEKILYSVYLANQLEEIISKCLYDFANYLNIQMPENKVLVSFSKAYDPIDTKLKLDTLIKMRERGDLSLETFINQVSSLEIFSEDIDEKEEKERVESELDLSPDNPIDPDE